MRGPLRPGAGRPGRSRRRVHARSPDWSEGLDYYTRTTFELAAEALDSAQNAVGGGGRYDKLAEALGGPATPGIGFGMGIERLLLAADAEGVFPAPASAVDVWVVDATGGSHALALTHELRGAGVSADRGFDGRSMKSQFKSADRSGARLAARGWRRRGGRGHSDSARPPRPGTRRPSAGPTSSNTSGR